MATNALISEKKAQGIRFHQLISVIDVQLDLKLLCCMCISSQSAGCLSVSSEATLFLLAA